MTAQLVIELGQTPAQTRVFVDGIELTHVVVSLGIQIHANAEVNTVTLEVLADALTMTESFPATVHIVKVLP